MRKRIFMVLFFDLYDNRSSELTTARKDGKSPYHAKAMLERILVPNRRYKVLVLFFSAVLNKVKTAYTAPRIPRFSPMS
jgi:hypothetical protein